MELEFLTTHKLELKVLSYWNLNNAFIAYKSGHLGLKVLSYWNLNAGNQKYMHWDKELKVLSYWNLNNISIELLNGYGVT